MSNRAEFEATFEEFSVEIGSESVAIETGLNDLVGAAVEIKGVITATQLSTTSISSTFEGRGDLIVEIEEPSDLIIVVQKPLTITVVEEEDLKLITAAEDIPAFVAVDITEEDTVVVSDPYDITRFNKFCGISLVAVVEGQKANVKVSGIIERQDWSWDVVNEIYIGENGALVNEPPPNPAFMHQIATVITSKMIRIDPQKPLDMCL